MSQQQSGSVCVAEKELPAKLLNAWRRLMGGAAAQHKLQFRPG
jgi:hypothetical protein